MKSIIVTIIGLGVIFLSAKSEAQGLHGSQTPDPVAHFQSVYEMTVVQKLLKLEVDLDNDGRVDILLGHIDRDPDTEELTDFKNIGWWVYLNKADGQYVLAGQKTGDGSIVDSVPGFNREQYWFGLIPEINSYGLLYLSCGRGGQALCQLKAIVIDGDAWKEIPIGEPMNAEQHYDELAQRFTSPPTPAIQELNP